MKLAPSSKLKAPSVENRHPSINPMALPYTSAAINQPIPSPKT
ncbi:hypothetical protein [Oceanobacillus profundus]